MRSTFLRKGLTHARGCSPIASSIQSLSLCGARAIILDKSEGSFNVERVSKPDDGAETDRDRILRLLAAGQLASLQEAASLVKVTPQRIGQWCVTVGLDWREARRDHLYQLWAGKAKRAAKHKGKGSASRHSKNSLREMGERAAARFWSQYRPS